MKYIVYYKDDFGRVHQAIHETKEELETGKRYKVQVGSLGEYYIDKWEKVKEDEDDKKLLLY